MKNKVQERLLVVMLVIFISVGLIAAIAPTGESVSALYAPAHVIMEAGESMRVHCGASQLIVVELGAHWYEGEIHQDFEATCDYGDD